MRPKPESFSVAGVSPLGASGPRGWKASPGDHRDEFIPNTGPPHSEGLSLHACPMCRAYLYSNSHLFLLPMTFQQGIPKLSGLNRDLFIFSLIPLGLGPGPEFSRMFLPPRVALAGASHSLGRLFGHLHWGSPHIWGASVFLPVTALFPCGSSSFSRLLRAPLCHGGCF